MNRGLRLGLLIAGTLVAALAVGMGTRFLILGNGQGEKSPVSTGAALIGGDFELLDNTGRTVTQADYAGKLLLVYFGYTFCPDVCPTELQVMAQAMDDLGAQGEEVQPLFITVDPERDTVDVMADYVEIFHPRLIGLTGSLQQVAKAARAYRVYYAKVKDEDSSTDYFMDHTSFIYLMGRDGRYLAHFPAGTAPEKIAEKVRSFL